MSGKRDVPPQGNFEGMLGGQNPPQLSAEENQRMQQQQQVSRSPYFACPLPAAVSREAALVVSDDANGPPNCGGTASNV